MTTEPSTHTPIPVIKFLIGDRVKARWSYAWRIWSGGTSFYMKPLAAWAQYVKISLHGPDPARDLRGGYKIELDSSAAADVRHIKNDWPDKLWFPGAKVEAPVDVDLVMRLRLPWDLFTPDAHPPQAPRDPRASEFGGLIAMPEPGFAIDVEILVCKSSPWWPNEEKARRDRACLGPIINKAGQYLTAVAVHHEIASLPSPLVDYGVVGQLGGPPGFERVRGLGAQLDERGFLWVHEMWLSRAALQAADLRAFRRA